MSSSNASSSTASSANFLKRKVPKNFGNVVPNQHINEPAIFDFGSEQPDTYLNIFGRIIIVHSQVLKQKSEYIRDFFESEDTVLPSTDGNYKYGKLY